MAEQLKINIPGETCFNTIRTALSRLWFVNNPSFDAEIKGYLAKYQAEFGVVIHHFIIMGNHYHLVARFPRANRHEFMKRFNRIFSNVARRHITDFPGGPLWARRYRPQALPQNEDIMHWFFYSALNPIHSGLTKNLSNYKSYNGFHDAISGRPVKCKLVNWQDYRNRRRYKANLRPEDCTDEHELVYSRLPGFENLSTKDYRSMMQKEFETRRTKAISERLAKGLGFASPKQIQKTPVGDIPKSTKTSRRYSRRPLVLTLSAKARKAYLDWYFSVVSQYKKVLARFKAGEWSKRFPPGTFSPPCCSC
jgi:REP element-mobilizing transposase RayT